MKLAGLARQGLDKEWNRCQAEQPIELIPFSMESKEGGVVNGENENSKMDISKEKGTASDDDSDMSDEEENNTQILELETNVPNPRIDFEKKHARAIIPDISQ